MKGIKKILGLVVLGSIVIGNLIGCGAKTEETVSENKTESVEESVVQSTIENVAESSAEAENKSAEVPKGFNYVPLKNTEGREIKIATLTVSNNPFWNTVVEGIDAAKEYLADSNVTVDVIEFEDFDGQAFAEAIDTCIVKGYDAITTVGVADTIVPAINKATDAGIPVYTFNSDTEKESKRVAFVGQDLYTAGGVAAQKAVELMGETGKVGIITGYYNVNAHELRRQGIEDELSKYSGIEVVGSVENHDSGDEAYTATKDFITANPDINAILVTAGGPHGVAKAIEELGMQDKITLVCFDTTDEIVAYLEKGIINATITQDPYGQGCDPIVLAYNQVISGKAEVGGKAYTAMDAYTPENVKEIKE